MKVQFEFTAADMAEVGTRAVSGSAVVQRWRRQARIITAILFGLLVYLAVPASTGPRIIAAFFVAGLAVGLRKKNVPSAARNKRVTEFWRERLGGDGPFLCEVEITEAGILTRQLGAEARHAWSHVSAVTDGPDGIQFTYRPVGMLLVRARAFPDPQTRAEFLSLSRRFLESKVPS